MWIELLTSIVQQYAALFPVKRRLNGDFQQSFASISQDDDNAMTQDDIELDIAIHRAIEGWMKCERVQ